MSRKEAQAANSRCSASVGYAATVEDGVLTIRPNMSGIGGWWFIRVVGGSYCVFETVQYGGDSYHLQDFGNISDALELANSLA